MTKLITGIPPRRFAYAVALTVLVLTLTAGQD